MNAIAHEYKETLLKLDGVSVRKGDNQILRDVNLEIKNLTRPGLTQGQVVGLLGPSGMGKTTLVPSTRGTRRTRFRQRV